MLSILSGKTIAVVVCSGFEERPLVDLQRALLGLGSVVRIISRDVGTTNAWDGSTWGLSYPVDSPLAESLAVDYDALIIPHGVRHTELLKNEAHGRRLIGAFLNERVPSLIIGSGYDVLETFGFASGTAPASITADDMRILAPAGADIAEMLKAFAWAMDYTLTDTEAA